MNEEQRMQHFLNEIPPPKITKAAMDVYVWFATRGVQYWCLGGCASRKYFDEREQILNILQRESK